MTHQLKSLLPAGSQTLLQSAFSPLDVAKSDQNFIATCLFVFIFLSSVLVFVTSEFIRATSEPFLFSLSGLK